MKRNVKKILVLMVLSLVGLTSVFANEYANKHQELLESLKARMWTEWFAPKTKRVDTNIERYLEMKAEVENLEAELEQKDKVDLIGLRELEKLGYQWFTCTSGYSGLYWECPGEDWTPGRVQK